MLTQTEEQLRARAERVFKKRELQKADAPQAVKEYYASIEKTVERRKQLRAARLSREAKGGF